MSLRMNLLRSAEELRECRMSSEAVRECAVAVQPWPFLEEPRWSHDEFRECPEWRDDDAPVTELHELTPDEALGISGTRTIAPGRWLDAAVVVVAGEAAVGAVAAAADTLESAATFACTALAAADELVYSCDGTSAETHKSINQ